MGVQEIWKLKKTLDKREETDHPEASPPPAYEQIDGAPPTSSLPPLDPYKDAGEAGRYTVTTDQCIVHLKFLAVLADLRDNISTNDGLFGLSDAEAEKFPLSKDEVLARIREKRWAIYTARAVDRFYAWWQNCIPRGDFAPTLQSVQRDTYGRVVHPLSRMTWSPDKLPPLGE